MKTMLKLTLMIALLGSTAMADGEMGSGGRTDNPPPPSSDTVQQGGVGTVTQSDTVNISTDFVLGIVKDTLDILF